MDPFSVTVGAVGLADSGMTLAGFLQDKYKAYRDAPKEILEIADEVQFCSSLVDTLSASLDKAVDSYSSAFVRDARTLVTKVCVPLSIEHSHFTFRKFDMLFVS